MKILSFIRDVDNCADEWANFCRHNYFLTLAPGRSEYPQYLFFIVRCYQMGGSSDNIAKTEAHSHSRRGTIKIPAQIPLANLRVLMPFTGNGNVFSNSMESNKQPTRPINNLRLQR